MQQTAAAYNHNNRGIDSMLQSPYHPNIIDVDGGFTNEVIEGIDGGCKKKTNNLQEGVKNGGFCLMFCMRGCILTIVQTLEPIP